MQEGNGNYGSPANASGGQLVLIRPLSEGSLSHLSALMHHGPAARRKKRALAATGGGLEAGGCRSVSHMQERDSIPCPGRTGPLGGVPSLLQGSQPLGECNRCNWPA